MYKMSEFTEPDGQLVLEFIQAHPFAMLTGNNGLTSVATQVPLLVHKEGDSLVLRGHIMRKTDHHIAFEKNPEVLVLFNGPQCYVSASWYSERGIGSTWNYMTVHARGKMRFMEEAATIELLKDLTHRFEDGRPGPELLENMADAYVHGLVKAVAGFEITVETLYPIFKLSQNRDDESYKRIVSELNTSEDAGAQLVAKEMIKRRPLLFG